MGSLTVVLVDGEVEGRSSSMQQIEGDLISEFTDIVGEDLRT